MNKADAIARLIAPPLNFERRTAAAYVSAKGRCEYCDTPVIFDRRYYASAQIDHLLTRSIFPASVTSLENNFALSCGLCNSLKRNYVPSTVSELDRHDVAALAQHLESDARKQLISECRAFINDKRKEADKAWHAARCVFCELDRDEALHG